MSQPVLNYIERIIQAVDKNPDLKTLVYANRTENDQLSLKEDSSEDEITEEDLKEFENAPCIELPK
jgi:hypothetical protein